MTQFYTHHVRMETLFSSVGANRKDYIMMKEQIHDINLHYKSLLKKIGHHNARKLRYKKILTSASKTSSREIFEKICDFKNGISPNDLTDLIKKMTNASTWIGHTYLRYLISHVNFTSYGNSISNSEKVEDILEHVRRGIPLNGRYSHDDIFKAIYDECELRHYFPDHKPALRIPKTNVTVVLISGVLNEIFSTAAFERGADHLCQISQAKYITTNVKGTKSSEHNSELIAKQLQKYIEENPEEKLWLIGFSKGGVDALHFMRNHKIFCERNVIGLSTVASPILGSDHVNNKFIGVLNQLHKLSDNPIYKYIEETRGVLGPDFQKSLSSSHQRVWFRHNHQELPKSPFYTSVAFESSWYESHLWMILTKLIFRSRKSNDGVVDVENASFPSYFNGINLGILRGHHLVGTRSSHFCQEALMESHLIFLKYLGLID